MNSRVILLNGPKGCGKTIVSEELVHEFGAIPVAMKNYLHQATQVLFGINEEEYFEIYVDRDIKEVPIEKFLVTHATYLSLVLYGYANTEYDNQYRYRDGLYMISIREAMIVASELVLKLVRGRSVFGQEFVKAVEERKGKEAQIIIDDSIGFVEELEPVIHKFGQPNILLLRIQGRGDFNSDSRRFIPDGIIENTVDIDNTGTREEFIDDVIQSVERFLNE